MGLAVTEWLQLTESDILCSVHAREFLAYCVECARHHVQSAQPCAVTGHQCVSVRACDLCNHWNLTACCTTVLFSGTALSLPGARIH